MSRDASIELDWGDGTYTFRLAWAQLEKLQEDTDCGPMFLLRRLREGSWRIGDIANTVRWALIGGGLKPVDAMRLTRTYVQERPLSENVLVAQAVLAVAIHGAPEEKLGEAQGEAATSSTTSPAEKSASQESTEPAQ